MAFDLCFKIAWVPIGDNVYEHSASILTKFYKELQWAVVGSIGCDDWHALYIV